MANFMSFDGDKEKRRREKIGKIFCQKEIKKKRWAP